MAALTLTRLPSQKLRAVAHRYGKHKNACTVCVAAKLKQKVKSAREPYDKTQQSYTQTLISAMIKSHKKVGAEKVLNKSYNAISIDPKMLDCDYFRFKELDPGAVNAYECEYMSQYYWADFLYNGLDD